MKLKLHLMEDDGRVEEKVRWLITWSHVEKSWDDLELLKLEIEVWAFYPQSLLSIKNYK
jgi:hypothetical protein